MTQLKNCKTCGHRDYEWAGSDKCMLTGNYCSSERAYPTKCGENFKGWVPNPPGLIKKLLNVFIIEEDNDKR